MISDVHNNCRIMTGWRCFLHFFRGVPSVVSDFETEFHHRGTNSIKGDSGGGGGGGVKGGGGSPIKYHEVDCVINGDYPIKCRREGSEVFLPFSFVQKYFEVGPLFTSGLALSYVLTFF